MRSLPPEEWPRLAATGADFAQVQQAATTGDVLVVERDGEIVACATVLLCAHLEAIWVKPEERFNLRVGRRLWRAVKDTVKAFGAFGVFGSAVTDTSDHMIRSLGGVQLDGRHYVIGMTHGR